MSVNVKLSSGLSAPVPVANFKMTVGELKQAAAGPTNIPANEQRMVFRGKILKDEQVLEEIGLKDGDALHVVRSAMAASTPSTDPPVNAPLPPAQPSAPTPAPQPQVPLNPYAALFGAQSGGGGQQQPGVAQGMWPGMMPGAMPGMGANNDMGATLQFFQQNPAMLQLGLQQMQQNPQLVEQALSQHPMFQGMTAEQRQQMLQMYTNPQFLQLALGMMGAGSNSPLGGAPQMQQPLPNMFGGAPPQPQGDPRVIYAAQLEQLRNMGFPNEAANIHALQQANGNIEFAVARLLGD